MAETWKDLAREAQEKAVINAAIELMEEKGFAFITMDEIADKAGISKATIYKLFPSKEVLFLRVVEDLHRKVRDELSKIPTSDFSSSFPKLIDLFISELTRRYNFVRLMMIEAMTHAPFVKENRQRLHRTIMESREFYRDMIMRFLQDGKKKGYFQESEVLLGGFILSLFKGAVMEVPFYKDKEGYMKFLQFVKEKILWMVGLKGGDR